jgi:cobalt-precorrin 5A hydrolase
MIAPHICSKQTDPAVIAVDDRGRYAVPLLSGHLGGANPLAEMIAQRIGAEAVITTATDIGGKFSPDSFAKANQLLISDYSAAKEIAAAVLDGETIGFQCAYPFRNVPPELSVCKNARCGIVIANDDSESVFPVTLHLKPKNIVVGIGCRKGVSAEQIENAVKAALEGKCVDTERICKAASIDLKANETGLLQFCKSAGVHLDTYSADELMAVPGDFSHSEFAEKVTGADNICERSAVLCSGGKLVIRKTSRNGVTVAAAEMPVEIDFERRML